MSHVVGGLDGFESPLIVGDASWQAPQRTKEVIAAEDAYVQERKAFEKLFEQAGQYVFLESSSFTVAAGRCPSSWPRVTCPSE